MGQIESIQKNSIMQYKHKNIELFDKTEPKNKRNKVHHLYVSTDRSYLAVRNDTIEHISN